MRPFLPTTIALALLVALAPACSSTKAGKKYAEAAVAQKLTQLETPGLVIGEFPIDGASSVIDGDTIRVIGLDSSLRLLGIDTEETFKHDAERVAYQAGWAAYKKAMRGSSERPVKMASPLGEDAKHFAQQFFSDVQRVRLERDHPGEIRDYYGRYLAYVLVYKNGAWLNYNLECIKAGLSPYFTKYGRARRFHEEFAAAQEKAREQQIGVWAPGKEHYDDYDERLAWWNARAEAIWKFEQEMDQHPNWFALTRWDSMLKLEQHVGKEVVLLASVGDIKLGDHGPTVVKLSRNRKSDVDVIFFDKDVFLSSGIGKGKGEFVTVRGVVSRYSGKHSDARQAAPAEPSKLPARGGSPQPEPAAPSRFDRLQIVVNMPSQVSLAGGKAAENEASDGEEAE